MLAVPASLVCNLGCPCIVTAPGIVQRDLLSLSRIRILSLLSILQNCRCNPCHEASQLKNAHSDLLSGSLGLCLECVPDRSRRLSELFNVPIHKATVQCNDRVQPLNRPSNRPCLSFWCPLLVFQRPSIQLSLVSSNHQGKSPDGRPITTLLMPSARRLGSSLAPRQPHFCP